MSRTFIVLSILLSASAAWAGETPYTGEPYEHNKITIQADKIWHKSGKVWFKLTVVNGNDKVVVFDKEQIQAEVGGKVVSREKSVFAGTAKPSDIAPGTSKPLWVEYKANDTETVSLILKRGFTLDGKPIELPNYTAKPGK
jgi:hypothetical protein